MSARERPETAGDTAYTPGRIIAGAVSDLINAQYVRYADRSRAIERAFERLVQVFDDALAKKRSIDGMAYMDWPTLHKFLETEIKAAQEAGNDLASHLTAAFKAHGASPFVADYSAVELPEPPPIGDGFKPVNRKDGDSQ